MMLNGLHTVSLCNVLAVACPGLDSLIAQGAKSAASRLVKVCHNVADSALFSHLHSLLLLVFVLTA